MDKEKELLTVEDVAKALGKSEYTVKQYFRKGTLPGFQIGGTWYIRRQAWEQYLKDLEEQEQNKK